MNGGIFSASQGWIFSLSIEVPIHRLNIDENTLTTVLQMPLANAHALT